MSILPLAIWLALTVPGQSSTSQPSTVEAPAAGPATSAPVSLPSEAEPPPAAVQPRHLPPPTSPTTTHLTEPDEAVEVAAQGSVEVCEALGFPLQFLPGVGSVLGVVVEWGCLVPAILAVQYLEAFHGVRAPLYWQQAVALVAAKLFRDLLKYPGIAAAVALCAVYAMVAVPALIFAPYFVPVGIAGLLTTIGVGYVVFEKLRDKGTSWVYATSYQLLSSAHPDIEAQVQARAASLVKPPLNGWARAYGLLAAAAGAEPERGCMSLVPVVGPIVKATAQGLAVKREVRRMGHEVLHEHHPDFSAVDTTATVLTTVIGWSGATGQALLVGGGVLFFAGSLFAALQYQADQRKRGAITQYALVAGTTGAAGIMAAGAGLAVLLVREIPKALLPFAVGAAYGLLPPGEEAAATP